MYLHLSVLAGGFGGCGVHSGAGNFQREQNMDGSLFYGRPSGALKPGAACGTLRKLAVPLLAAMAVAAALPTSARAAESCDFFKNKTVELVVPFSPGGGFDVYARLVAKFMGSELGAANMIVRNQPGAGGMLGTNQTWMAKPDGLTIQMMPVSGMIASELAGADGVAFKSGEFSWIGRVSGEPDVVAASFAGKVRTVDDLKAIGKERKLRMGATGVGDVDFIEGWLLGLAFETEADVITGFSGSGEVYASLGRGEIDLYSSSLSAAASAEKAETARILWVFGDAIPERPDVKPLSQVIDAKFLPLIKAQADIVAAGRALAGPPKMPEDRLKCLRDAFDKTLASEPLLAESKLVKRPVAPLNGQAVTALVRGVTEGSPPELVELLRKSYAKK
jgi:tripartite-type tricarboxylate transporter receptor subunit TctC